MARFALWLTILAGALHGQPNPGDWIVGDLGLNPGTHGGIYRINPATGALSTVAVGGGGAACFNWVCMAEDNSGLVGGIANNYSTVPGDFARITPLGMITPLVYVGNNPNGIDLDQNGTWLMSAGGGAGGLCGLFRVNPGPPATSTQVVTCTNGTANNMCIDQENGDYLVISHTTGRVVRVNRLTNVQTVLATGLGALSGIDFEPRTGHFILSRFTSPSLLRLNRTTNVASVIPSVWPFASDVTSAKVDDETGRILVSTAPGTGLTCSVGVVNATTGASITSWNYFNSLLPSGAEIYGSRKVSGSGAATAGSTYTVRFSFPQSPTAPYVAALTTSVTSAGAGGSGLRPGLALNDGTGRVVNLNILDPLFLQTAGGLPGLTTGFSGVLNGQGRATGTIQIPAGTPAGIRIFVSAVAVNATMGSSLDTANTWAFTTN